VAVVLEVDICGHAQDCISSSADSRISGSAVTVLVSNRLSNRNASTVFLFIQAPSFAAPVSPLAVRGRFVSFV
jgi:hypothetical protein